MKLKKENICTLLFCFFLSFLFISFGFSTTFLDYMKEDMTTKIVEFISRNEYYNFATLYFPIIDNLVKILNELFYACFHILAFAILIVYTILKKKNKRFLIAFITLSSILIVIKPLCDISSPSFNLMIHIYKTFHNSNFKSLNLTKKFNLIQSYVKLVIPLLYLAVFILFTFVCKIRKSLKVLLIIALSLVAYFALYEQTTYFFELFLQKLYYDFDFISRVQYYKFSRIFEEISPIVNSICKFLTFILFIIVVIFTYESIIRSFILNLSITFWYEKLFIICYFIPIVLVLFIYLLVIISKVGIVFILSLYFPF